METSTAALTAFSFVALRLLSSLRNLMMWSLGQNTSTARVIVPQLHLDTGVKDYWVCHFVFKLFVGVSVLLFWFSQEAWKPFSSCLKMRGRKHEGFPTDLSKLDLKPHSDNPRESPIKAFTVNGESDTVLLCTILVQSPYSHTSTWVF